jgi:hypothetical protein
MTWLQGGPFLEISFLLTLELDRQSFVDSILTKLKSVNPTVELATTVNDLKEKISEFDIGYAYDDKDPNSKFIHQAQIPVYVDTDGKRKSILSLRQISDKLVAVDFWFFGSEWDAPEWNQVGITERHLPIFKDFLNSLFDTFDFIVGTMAYENSVTDLFATGDTWPNDKYSLDNINKQSFQVDHYFLIIIANKKYIDLHDINGVRKIGQRQTLETKK